MTAKPQFPGWLKSLGPVRADLPPSGAPPITRGLKRGFTVSYPGDVTSATLSGKVKSSPDATTALATFTIGAPSVIEGRTVWEFSLAQGTGANSTGSLPSDADGDGVETFLYDLLLSIGSQPAQRIAGGLYTVSGQITEPA